MRIYVASSWRNGDQPTVVGALRAAGHEVYDFRDPDGRGVPGGFQWSEIDPDWQSWTPEEFRLQVFSEIAAKGFDRDYGAMKWADAFVLVMPCGRSAHLELGWAIGDGKPAFILLSDGEPELMYRMATSLCTSIEEVLEGLDAAAAA